MNDRAPAISEVAPFSSLIHVIRSQSIKRPDHAALIFLADGETESARLTYKELDQRARIIAARLQADGLAGQPVVLLLPSGPSYVVGFLACLYAGAIPVPVYPPTS